MEGNVNILKQAYQFNQDILKVAERPLGKISKNEFELALKHLREEIDEMEKAWEEMDLAKLLDGMVDLDYRHKSLCYALGVKPGLYELLCDIVHEANCTKKPGVNPQRKGFGDAVDAIKPKDFKDPVNTIRKVLGERDV